MAYVDGFVLPVQKSRLADYRKIATTMGKFCKKHGAIDYVECVGQGLTWGKRTSFQRSVKLKKNEVVVFAWIVYKSKAQRNSIMKKVMNMPELMKEPKKGWPFDGKRMFMGEFKPIVHL